MEKLSIVFGFCLGAIAVNEIMRRRRARFPLLFRFQPPGMGHLMFASQDRLDPGKPLRSMNQDALTREMSLFGRYTLYTRDPDVIKKVLYEHKLFTRRTGSYDDMEFLLFSNGDKWDSWRGGVVSELKKQDFSGELVRAFGNIPEGVLGEGDLSVISCLLANSSAYQLFWGGKSVDSDFSLEVHERMHHGRKNVERTETSREQFRVFGTLDLSPSNGLMIDAAWRLEIGSQFGLLAVHFAKHPEWQGRCKGSWDHFMAFFSECNRLYPTVPAVVRECNGPLTIDGVEVPLGTRLVLDLKGAVGINDPEFEPGRYLEAGVFRPLKNQHIFSCGPMRCPAAALAPRALYALFSRVLSEYELAWQGGHEDRESWAVAWRYKLGVVVKFNTLK